MAGFIHNMLCSAPSVVAFCTDLNLLQVKQEQEQSRAAAAEAKSKGNESESDTAA